MKDNAPKIEIDSMPFEDGIYTRWSSDGKIKQEWKVPDLYKEVEEKKLKPFKVPLASLNLHLLPFDVDSLDDFIFQMKRVNEVDMTKPLLLDSYGLVCDGNHRIARAILEGKKYIKAYRLQYMPQPYNYVKINDKSTT